MLLLIFREDFLLWVLVMWFLVDLVIEEVFVEFCKFGVWRDELLMIGIVFLVRLIVNGFKMLEVLLFRGNGCFLFKVLKILFLVFLFCEKCLILVGRGSIWVLLIFVKKINYVE